MSVDNNTSGLVPQRQKESDYDNSGPVPQLQKTSDHNSSELRTRDHSNEPSSSTLVPNVVPPVDKSDSLQQEITQPTDMSPSTELTSPTTTVNAEEKNNDEAANA
ncbi:hypothetical protein Tco_0055449 [Tanacetum coccineum]